MALNEIITFFEAALKNIQFISETTVGSHWLIYGAIFILTLFEGPIATLTAAAISATGKLNPFLVFLFAATGNLTADFGYYLVGKLGKFEMVAWILRKIRVDQESIELLKEEIISKSAKTIFIAKISNSLIVPMLLTLGTIRIPFRKWAPALIAGEMVWSSFLMLAGYHFSSSIQKIETGSRYFGFAAGILILLVITFGLRRIFAMKKNKKLK